MIYDTFMFFNEVDMLECRLTELDGVVDRFVLIESGQTHQGKPKSSVFLEHAERFRKWTDAERLMRIWVDKFTAQDPFGREHEQREYARVGLDFFGTLPHDIVLHSDLDEIPTPASVLEIEKALAESTGKLVTMNQRMFCFAVDWEHPCGWQGPVAARYRDIDSFTQIRNRRDLYGPLAVLWNAGHHLSWLGGPERNVDKLDAFLHAEMAFMRGDIASGRHSREGYHVDGAKLVPVIVDETWPRYVSERRCPPSWFRSHYEGKEAK